MSQQPYDLGLAGRAALVTGGAGGIGSEVVRGLAAAGAHVAIVDIDESACEATRATLAEPDEHLAIGVDLARIDTHQSLVDRTLSAFGRLDILVCLAAVLRRRADLDDVTEEDWDTQLAVNLKATFFLNRTVAQVMRSAGHGGRIINFTSQGWLTGGFGGSVVYAASKGGVVSMSRGLARTFAPHDITVNCVSPGAADTSMMRSGMTEADLEEFTKMIPLGRMAKPSEVAAAVLFLASDSSSFITGATINVSGGQVMY